MDASANLRFSAAALAAGCTPKQLKHWLETNNIELATVPPETGQRRYGWLDVGIVAVQTPLVAFGIPVAEANRLAVAIVMRLDRPHATEAAARSGDLVEAWRRHRVQVYRVDGLPPMVRRVDLSQAFTPFGHLSAAEFYGMVRREIEPAPVFLTIDVAGVLEAAFARAAEILESQTIADGAVEGFAAALTDAFAQRPATV